MPPTPAAHAPDAPPAHEEIARLAYAIWEQEGRPHGRAIEHWLQAIARLAPADGGGPVKSKLRARPKRKLGLIEIQPLGGRTPVKAPPV